MFALENDDNVVLQKSDEEPHTFRYIAGEYNDAPCEGDQEDTQSIHLCRQVSLDSGSGRLLDVWQHLESIYLDLSKGQRNSRNGYDGVYSLRYP